MLPSPMPVGEGSCIAWMDVAPCWVMLMRSHRWPALICVIGAQVGFAEDPFEPQDPFGPKKTEEAPAKEKAPSLLPEKAESDAEAALGKSDTRFLDVTGYAAVVGVDRWDDGLKDKYGTRVIGPVGRMIFDNEQGAREKQIIEYGTRYNLHLVKLLKIQFPPEEKLEEKPEKEQIEDLINRLAFSNEPAVDRLFPTPSDTAPKMDRRVKIHDAYNSLWVMHGFAAFPQLVAHLDDERQSVQFDSIRRATVGKACYSILNNQLHDIAGYSYSWGRKGADGENHVRPGYFNPIYQDEGIKVWLDKRKGRSLAELQLEVMEWTLAREKEIGKAGDSDQERIIAPLEKQVALLRKQVEEEKAARK